MKYQATFGTSAISFRPIFQSAGAAVLSYDNQHIAARLVHTRFPLPVRRKRKE
jgi:hypothetical protein